MFLQANVDKKEGGRGKFKYVWARRMHGIRDRGSCKSYLRHNGNSHMTVVGSKVKNKVLVYGLHVKYQLRKLMIICQMSPRIYDFAVNSSPKTCFPALKST